MSHSRSFRYLSLAALLLGAIALVLVLAPVEADATTSDPAVAQVDPYQPPEIIEVDLPGWAEPFEPLARLPLWAQAALVSAGVAGLFFVVPVASRWVWSLGSDAEQSSDDTE